jgi:magnesium-transporting ATPase (P-type)
MNLTKITRSVLTDVLALGSVLTVGLVMRSSYHIPLIMSFMQLIGLELLVLVWPIATLRYDHDKHRVRDTHDRQVIFEIVLFGLIAAGLAMLSYLLFFARHSLSPVYIDPSNPLYLQATTVALLTLALCQSIHLFFTRADAEKKLSLHYTRKNKKLLQAWALSLFIVVNFVYDPLFQALFSTKPLSLLDWLSAVALAGLYFGAKLVQRHTREHTRHTVAKLHRELGKMPRA